MKIIIDISPFVHNQGGVGRYAKSLVDAIYKLDDKNQIILFETCVKDLKTSFNVPFPEKKLNWSKKRWRLSSLISLYLNLNFTKYVGEGDIFHATDHIFPNLPKQKKVFTIHDISYLSLPNTHLKTNSLFLKIAMPILLKKADKVICISEYTKKEVLQNYNISEDKTKMIYLGIDPIFFEKVDEIKISQNKTKWNIPEKYILYVGNIEPRKNLSRLIEAYSLVRSTGLEEKLIIAGKKSWLYKDIINKVSDLGLEKDVIFTGIVPDSDLPALYQGAILFVFPSLLEGFGLPPLEAMASGIPVITSSTSSLGEICSNSALTVDPQKVNEIAQAIKAVITNQNLKKDLINRGYKNAQKFNWEKTALETMEVYRSILDNRESSK